MGRRKNYLDGWRRAHPRHEELFLLLFLLLLLLLLLLRDVVFLRALLGDGDGDALRI
jgi:hypothetical protein